MPSRHFTVEEANKALPLVRLIVGDVRDQLRTVQDLQRRLAGTSSRRRRADDPYAEEVAHAVRELADEEAKLAVFVDELARIGVDLKGATACDFLSWRDGREVYLCWSLEDPEVRHWHELSESDQDRRPIASGARALEPVNA